MTAITVRSQDELDAALADLAIIKIIIDSPRGVWLHVRASGSATVQASAWVAIHLHSAHATVAGRHIIDVTVLDLQDPATWCAYHGVQVDDDGRACLYKAVDDDLTAGHAWQPTTYPVGQTVTAPDWRDDNSCGHGLHVCPRPAQARDHYHEATRYLEVAVPVDQLRPIDGSKANAPEVYVVREVGLSGRPVEVVEDRGLLEALS